MKKAVISLILGLLGVVLSALYIGLPFAIIGLVFGILSLKSPTKKVSIITNKHISYASIAINICAIVWGLITLVGLILYIFGVIE